MRTFSEYYNFYILKKEKLSDILVENAKSRMARYKMMFSKFLKEHDQYEKNIDRVVQKCVKILKKDNVIVFVLKTLRESMIKFESAGEDATSVIVSVNYFIDSLEHYLSLPIPEIQNYNYDNKTRSDVLQDFKTFEDEWKKSRVEWIDITDELKKKTITPIINYENGYAWFDLSRPYCELEGDAMGHCGNSASYSSDDTVLSYRAVKASAGTTMARPSLTFILNGDGYLGEMKGRANEKPKEKYHDAIVDLLLRSSSDEDQKEFFVKGIRGGGFQPETNFNINDLNETLKNKLFSQRPELMPFLDRIKSDNNAPSTEDIINELSKLMKVPTDSIVIPVPYTKQNINPRSNFAYVLQWSDWEALLGDVDDSIDLHGYKEYVERGFMEDNYNQRIIDKEEVMQFLETVMSKNSVVKNRIMNAINGWLTDYPEMADEGINIDPNDIEGVYNLLQINDRDVIMLVKRSIEDGEDSGAYNQLINRFKDGIKNVKFISEDGISFGVDYKNENEWSDSPLYAIFNLENLAKILDDKINPFESYDHDEGDMVVPQYGFDGYDEDYAISVFQDHLDI